MPIKTQQIITTDETKRRHFAPIRRDLLDRLSSECERKTTARVSAALHQAFRKLRLR